LESRGFKVQRTGGEGKKEDGFCLVRAEGEPERSESPREQKAPPRRKTSGQQKGTRLLGGSNSSEHRSKAGKVLEESAGAKGSGETRNRPLKRRKAPKGKAQERWRLKEISKGSRSSGRREGSQTLRAELLGGRAKPSGRFLKRGSEKKGP
jgi:hypothetical protein